MPIVYVAGSLILEVTLGKDEDYYYDAWTDSKLAESRKEYDHDNLNIQLEYRDEEKHEYIPVNIESRQAYEGSLTVARENRKFIFNLSGKFKISVHKNAKALIDAGMYPKLYNVCINGASRELQGSPLDTDLLIQSKKI